MAKRIHMNTQVSVPAGFSLGEHVGGWTAYDYHPHKRSWIWIIVFSLVVFGLGAHALITGEYMTAITFFVVAGVYFWVHRRGDKTHEVYVFEKGIVIDESFIAVEKITGYWFLYDETASLLHIEMKKAGAPTIVLQMGSYTPDVFRDMFEPLGLTELPDRKESLLDLWIRALKL